MSESTFSAGERAVFDLGDSSGTITLKDGDGPTIRIQAEGEQTPFVLREGDTFRVRLPGGTIAVPAGLPLEVSVPAAVQLRIERDAREGGGTVVKPIAAEPAAGQAPPADDAAGAPEPQDLNEFTRVMSERAQRIFADLTRAMRASNSGLADEVARRLDEAAGRIDEQARRVAERVQREVERANETVARAQEQARRAADRAEERTRHVAERWERRATRHESREAERAARHAARGRGWFADRLEQWATANTGRSSGEADRPGGATAAAEERRAILSMLAEGKITSDQASKLLDALG